MAQDISGFGIEATIIALPTFPAGFTVTEFADDADPFDLPAIQIAETAMTLNGDLINWSTAVPIPLTINVIPGSDDDLNLAALFEANRVGLGKFSTRDLITIVGTYPGPDARSITLINGRIVNGVPANSVTSSGRHKSKNYEFMFENRIGN